MKTKKEKKEPETQTHLSRPFIRPISTILGAPHQIPSFHIIPRLEPRPVRTPGDLHRHGDRVAEDLRDVDVGVVRFAPACCFGGVRFGLDDRDEDAALPVAAVELWFFCRAVLDEAAPVVIVIYKYRIWRSGDVQRWREKRKVYDMNVRG